jgi:hypothetical protein
MVDIAEVITINSPIGDMPFTVDSVQKLCDEIERLREALSAISASELVAKFNPNVDVKMMWIGCTNIARSALQQKESE